jgi:hypothetical protein
MNAASRWRAPLLRGSTAIRNGRGSPAPGRRANDGFGSALSRRSKSGWQFCGSPGRGCAPFSSTPRKTVNASAKATPSAAFSPLKSGDGFIGNSVKRPDLEHIIRAAGSIANSQALVIIGSQAILGSFPNPPPELTNSQDADTYPEDDPSKADLIDGSIGEKSAFHETFGYYYAHGVGPDTAVLPRNWRSRVARVQNQNTNGISGLCISPADLAISKLVAGREKDMEFVAAMLRHRLVSADQITLLTPEVPDEFRRSVEERFARLSQV